MFGLNHGAHSKCEKIYNSRELELERKSASGEIHKQKYSVYSTITKNEITPCLVCLGLPDEPVTYCKHKKHILCRSCYESLGDRLNNHCQICREPASPDGVQPVSTYKELYEHEELLCPAGCGMTFPLKRLQDHFRECREFDCDFCEFSGSLDELNEHMERCKPPLLTCVYCNQDYPVKDRKVHKTECREFPVEVECPDGKKRVIPRKDQSSVELMTALKAGKRPYLEVDNDSQTKRTCQCKLSDNSYKRLQQGVTAVIEYASEQTNGALSKRTRLTEEPIPSVASPVVNGLLALFSGVFGDNYKIIKDSKVISSFELKRSESIGSSDYLVDSRRLVVLLPDMSFSGKTPYGVKTMDFKLSGYLGLDEIDSCKIIIDPCCVNETLYGFVKLKFEIFFYRDFMVNTVVDLSQLWRLSKNNRGHDLRPFEVKLVQLAQRCDIDNFVRSLMAGSKVQVRISQMLEVLY